MPARKPSSSRSTSKSASAKKAAPKKKASTKPATRKAKAPRSAAAASAADSAPVAAPAHAPANEVAPAEAPAPPSPARAGTVADQRLGIDRRRLEAEAPTGLERRRSAGRRLSDFTRSAEEGELTQEQFLFLMAIDAFKKANDTSFPTWTDVLEIVRLLGYRKTMASELSLRAAEDWREPPFGPSGVRTERQMMRDREARQAADERAQRDAA